MATIKKSINTESKTTAKKAVNSFKLNEKSMTLTLGLSVEWNKTRTALKATHLEKVEGKEYQKMVFTDTKGNQLFLFKTGFNYEPVVKESVKGVDLSKATEKLSDDEQKMLELLLKKMSK